MQLIRERRAARSDADAFRGMVRVDECVVYDLLASLLVLYSPRLFPGFRRWAAGIRKRLPAELLREGRFFFQGHETCIGFGVVRMVPDLPRPATPRTLVEALRHAEPASVARMMQDGPGGVSAATRQRFEAVDADPTAARDRLVAFLERYVELVFDTEADRLRPPLRDGARKARDTLGVLSTVDAIEHVTGGYTLSTDLPLERIVLAPSVFLYPAVACRIDEHRAEAFIMYGVASTLLETDDRTLPVGPHVMSALKALSDPNRVHVLRLVSERPRLTSELVSLLALSQPAVHHHVRELWSAGLVRQERTRNGMLYALREDGLRGVIAGLSELL